MDFEEEIEEQKPRVSRIPKVYILITLSFFTTFLLYINRDLLKISMGLFLKPQGGGPMIIGDPYACNVTIPTNSTEPRAAVSNHVLYEWSPQLQGSIHQCFLYGYTSTLIVGGVYADKYGVRRMGLAISLASAGLIAVCPLIVKNCGGMYQFLQAWNFVFGMVTGLTLPMVDSLMGQWIRPGTKTMVVCLTDTGVFLGNMFGRFFGSVLIMKFDDWSIMFYIFASFEVIFCVFWYFFSFSSPETHPTITDQEKVTLRENLGPYVEFKNKGIPWKDMLKCIRLWAVFINYLVTSYSGWLMMGITPMFFAISLKLNSQNPVMAYVPFICAGVIGLLLSVFSDYLIRKNLIELTTIRKIYTNFASMGSGIFLVATTYTSCIEKLEIALYSITIICFEFYFTAAHVPILDLAPNFAGTIRGISNTLGICFVLGSSHFMQPLLNRLYLEDFRLVFWVTLIFYTVANLVFALSYRGDEQHWNVPPHIRRKDVSRSSLNIDQEK